MALYHPGGGSGTAAQAAADQALGPTAAPGSTGAGGDPRRRVAVVDIGSNSIRLVVYDALSRVPVPIVNEKVMCGLGRGLGQSGRLNPEARALALANLARFKALIDALQVGRYQALATAAVRDAADGPEFLDQITRCTGLAVNAISGDEEARLGAHGVLSGMPGADGVMGDLGGGSLELVGLDHGVIGPRVSLPLGVLRLLDANQSQPPATPQPGAPAGPAAAPPASGALRLIEDHLRTVPWLERYRRRPFIAVGGNWRALGQLQMDLTHYPLHVIHQYTLPGALAREFAGRIAREPKAGLDGLTGGPRRRNDTLAPAALLAERLLRTLESTELVFSACGLREGWLYDQLGPTEQRQDPLISACTLLATRMGRFGAGETLAAWTDGLFAGEDAATARLRRAACLLSDLGWAEHPDYRAEHGCLRVLRLPLIGIGHRERGFLALSVFIRYGGRADAPPAQAARALVSDSLLVKAQVLGLALRLAHALTGGLVGLLERITLRLGDETLTLALPEDLAPLAGDVTSRRLEALARILHRTPQVQVLPGGRGS